jgi:hypothetical protein
MRTEQSTEERLFSLIELWQKGNISQKSFCEQNNIAYHVFHYWYRRYRQQQPGGNVFTELSVSRSREASVTLTGSNGIRLEVSCTQESAGFIKTLLLS